MNSEDFLKLPNFTELEVEATGADIVDVDFETLNLLQRVRSYTGKRVGLIKNGLTTGEHQSELHGGGKAVDFKFLDPISPKLVIFAMIKAGFNGVGVYRWSKTRFTFHGDSRKFPANWFRVPNQSDVSIFTAGICL